MTWHRRCREKDLSPSHGIAAPAARYCSRMGTAYKAERPVIADAARESRCGRCKHPPARRTYRLCSARPGPGAGYPRGAAGGLLERRPGSWAVAADGNVRAAALPIADESLSCGVVTARVGDPCASSTASRRSDRWRASCSASPLWRACPSPSGRLPPSMAAVRFAARSTRPAGGECASAGVGVSGRSCQGPRGASCAANATSIGDGNGVAMVTTEHDGPSRARRR
jgi:hypothetical protein